MMTQTIRHTVSLLAAVCLVFAGAQSLRAAEQVKVDVALANQMQALTGGMKLPGMS